MSRKFVIFLGVVILSVCLSSYIPIKKQAKDRVFTVVLDAGHGGKDPGKKTKHYNEKDIALNIVLKIGKELEKHDNIKVVYTRKTDVFVDLYERGRIANEANADLFVSVHCNAHNSQAYGAETWVLGLHANKQNFKVAKEENSVIFLEEDYEQKYDGFDPNDEESVISLLLMQEEYLDQSIQLAGIIQNGFTNKLKRRNRKVKQAGFIVLHQTFMPSVLIETGFITNKYEGAYLSSTKGQLEMAKSIATSVLNYRKVVSQNLSLDEVIEKEEPEMVTSDAEPVIVEGVTFKVQIAASSRLLETEPYNFNGLSTISRESFNDLYRYFYGNTSNYTEAERLQAEAREKGYPSAYLVAYKDGQRISVSEALRSVAN
ncbi:N-acetylmuramoyl-L-alanine amidase [Sungkyunkwania multivorans]|uniref:N-acetylmuramoyl-L-alanine amidase n=1 Tax=Sungkyunkwania multivorans TaxID=1173618 RepID=A0ABW3CZ84_9FLAO